MPEPDEAQQDGAPRQRATQPTARQIAETLAADIQRLADDVQRVNDIVDAYEGDHIRETVATHRNLIHDLRGELDGFQNAINRQVERLRANGAGSTAGPSLEEIAEQVVTVVKPEQDRVAAKISELLARLDSVERRASELEARPGAGPTGGEGYATQLQVRVSKLEELLTGAAKAVEHLPVPSDLLDRLESLEKQVDFINLGMPQANQINLGGVVAERGPIQYRDPQSFQPKVGGVHAKVLELMRRVTAIGKERTADQGTGGRFKFRGIDEAMDAVGHAMREVGLTMETEVLDKSYAHNPVTNTYEDRQTKAEKQRTVLWTTATVTYRYIFVDPTDGSRHTFEMAGEGRDASDKGTSKAGSMALKYGLFQALMIPVSGLDDSDTESPQVQQDRPAPSQQRAEQSAQQSPPPADQQKPAKSKTERALDAVTAVRNIDRWPVDQRLDKLVAISSLVEQEGLGSVEIDGATVRAHIAATERTLAQFADDPPPF